MSQQPKPTNPSAEFVLAVCTQNFRDVFFAHCTCSDGPRIGGGCWSFYTLPTFPLSHLTRCRSGSHCPRRPSPSRHCQLAALQPSARMLAREPQRKTTLPTLLASFRRDTRPLQEDRTVYPLVSYRLLRMPLQSLVAFSLFRPTSNTPAQPLPCLVWSARTTPRTFCASLMCSSLVVRVWVLPHRGGLYVCRTSDCFMRRKRTDSCCQGPGCLPAESCATYECFFLVLLLCTRTAAVLYCCCT